MLNVPPDLDLEDISGDASLDTPPDNVKSFPFHGILSLAKESLQGSKLYEHRLNASMSGNRGAKLRCFHEHRNLKTLAHGLVESRDQCIVPHRVQSLGDVATRQTELASLCGPGSPLAFRQDKFHVHFEPVRVDYPPRSFFVRPEWSILSEGLRQGPDANYPGYR